MNAVAPNSARVVDLGGGEGNLGQRLRPDLQKQYTIIDREPGNAAFRVIGDLANVCVAEGSADVVCLSDVLEHVPDDRSVILEALRVVRPGGRLIVHVPSLRASPMPFIVRAIADDEAKSHQEFPHVRDGYSVFTLSHLLGDGATIEPSFTPLQSLISDFDLFLWIRGHRAVRTALWALIRLSTLMPDKRSARNASGLLGVVKKHVDA